MHRFERVLLQNTHTLQTHTMSDSEHHHSHPDPCQQSPQDIDELDSQLNTSNSWQAALAKYRPLLIPAAKALALFVFCFVALILLLDNLLPSIDPADRPAVKIPRNFEELKALNQVLQIYNERHFLRVLGSFIALYLLCVIILISPIGF